MTATSPTQASILRLNHAREIADSCPENLFDQIALTGSSARGIATDDSDIEINFWVYSLPDLQSRADWIPTLNVTDMTVHTEPRPDNSYWINANYKGIELESGWQTFIDLDHTLNTIIKAQTTDHKTLRLAELILSAIPLRGTGNLEKWQSTLQHYPQELAPRLIESALTNWITPAWQNNRLREKSHKEDIHRIWRILYALNRKWEINWKYASHYIDFMQIYPKNLLERIWDISHSDSQPAHKTCLNLINDTLELIKTNHSETTSLTQNLNHLQTLLMQI